MDITKLKFNMSEIAAATGIESKTLQSRKTALGKTGEISTVKGKRSEYTYDEVIKLIRKLAKPGEPRTEYVKALQQQLRNDGFLK